MMRGNRKAVDLFAGPGGWDVGATRLGLDVTGIERDHAACETRRAAGLGTVEGDVRDYGPAEVQGAFGLKPWISMAEAIGWGMTHRPALTIAVGTAAGGPDPSCVGGSGARATLYGERDAGRWINCRRIVDADSLPVYRGGRRDTIRVTPEDAALLQTFPAGHPFQGSQTKRYEQVGNAVPCLLAEHVIATAFGIPMTRPETQAA